MTSDPISTPDAGSDVGTQAAESDHKVIKGMLGELSSSTELTCIRDIVTALSELLPEHFDGEEGPDGLYEELRLMKPGLSPKLDALARDHSGLRREITELQRLCRQIEDLRGQLCALKDRFIAHLSEHEATESGLVADAYYIDLGESG